MMPKKITGHPELNPENRPAHIAIIMDGNGRWAEQRNLPRSKGHLEGLSAAKRIVKTAADLGVPHLSLYAFSTENWKRAKSEVKYLMFLVKSYLRQEYKFYQKNKIKVSHSGDLDKLPRDVARSIQTVMEKTKTFTGLKLNLAINYGGRDEIVRSLARCLAAKEPVKSIMESDITANLDRPEFPDVDLLIRTGGEKRISNFLLWESAYAELFFSDKLWPDWDGDDLLAAVADYQKRQRRFGGLG